MFSGIPESPARIGKTGESGSGKFQILRQRELLNRCLFMIVQEFRTCIKALFFWDGPSVFIFGS